MEAQAFVEPNLDVLLDTASRLIPGDSILYALLNDLRAWRADEPDWKRCFRRVEKSTATTPTAATATWCPTTP
jgi:hypothetical protein